MKIVFEFDEWVLFECNSCGLRFGIDNSNTQNGTRSTYNIEYYNSKNSKKIGYSNYSSSEVSKKLTFNSYFKTIEKYISPKKYLDIGCAFGFSIEVAKARGWKSQGIDISEFACKIAYERSGISIYYGDFLLFDKYERYDLISAWDVLEHTTSPSKFFSQVRRYLNEDGIVVLTTPNSRSLVAKFAKRNWFEYKWPEHRFFLCNKLLKLYCKKYGFRILRLQLACKYKTVGDALCRWLGLYENRNIFDSKIFDTLIPYSSFCETFLVAQKN